jgi:hypothetical protein
MDWKGAGFSMQSWAKFRLPQSPTLGCGTQCCAFGVGTTLPGWKEAGLKLIPYPNLLFERKLVGGVDRWIPSTSISCEILGITFAQFTFIFGALGYMDIAWQYVTPRHVIDNIRIVLGDLPDPSKLD